MRASRIAAAVLFLVSGVPASQPVFTVRGWDLERFDPAYVREMIDRAHEAGINTISLSHEIVMNAEEILHDWHRYKHLRQFCDHAHRYNMNVYLWNHQINNPPEELVRQDDDGVFWLDFDSDRLPRWLHDRYRRVVERVPNLDGIILSLTESQYQIHRDASEPAWFFGNCRVRSALKPAQRMARVINTIHGALDAAGKRLIVRDFLRSPGEMRAFAEALESVPDDVWVYTKCVPNDWHFLYPPHPLLGKVGPHPQVLELDLFNETGAACRMMLPAPYYYQRQIRMAREKGLIGVIPRVDDGFATHRGTPAEFNVYVYNRLIHDPDADVDAMWPEFFVPFYGEAAAPIAIECLKEMYEIVCGISYTLGFWTGRPGVSPGYTDSHLAHHSSALWSDDPKYKTIERLLRESGPEAIRRTVEEKRQAERGCTRCLAKLDEARGYFNREKFIELRGYFEEGRQQARIGQLWARAYWALRWYRNTQSTEALAETRAGIEACRSFIHAPAAPLTAYLEQLSPEQRERFRVGSLPEFVRELEQAIAAPATSRLAD